MSIHRLRQRTNRHRGELRKTTTTTTTTTTVFVVVASVMLSLAAVSSVFVAATAPPPPTTTAPSTCDSCSDALDLQRRVSRAIHKDDGVSLTEEGRSLRATLDNVLSEADCKFLVDNLPPGVFVDAGGYESTSNQYTASRNGYSGIGLTELAVSASADTDANDGSPSSTPTRSAIFSSPGDYGNFLEFRERVRAATERALNLCPGTLKIDYTHISQKTAGGTHRPHADNCFHYYRPIDNNNGDNNKDGNNGGVAATVDTTRRHPYSQRVAASILRVLLGEPIVGGRDSRNDRRSQDRPDDRLYERHRKPARSPATSGNNGDDNDNDNDSDCGSDTAPRRLALAMWYVTDPAYEEVVPKYGQHDPTTTTGTTSEEDADPNRTVLFEIPTLGSIRVGGLRLALGLYLVGKQNTPSRASWRANQHNDRTLHAIFADQTAMVSIVLKDDAIVVGRHTDGIRQPSLRYQLQESVLLHGILDELEALSAEEGEGRTADDRLVRLEQEAIDRARDTLPTKR
eukprot:jgi/Psemu1/12422/gm1.12422_g